MLKRPINSRFNQAVLDGRKFTTIREKPWPTWKEIMLYNWTGAAYRSKQVDVAAVLVESESEILITNCNGQMVYQPDSVDGIPIYQTEGFDTMTEMDCWFEKLVEPGQTIAKHLMRFRLVNEAGPARGDGKCMSCGGQVQNFRCHKCGYLGKPTHQQITIGKKH
jgi:hypothetical protein